MNTSIVNHLRLAWIVLCRDALISVAVPTGWPGGTDAKFWEMSERIEKMRGVGHVG